MLRLGEKQELIIVKRAEFGVYLAESKESEENRVLLPIKQVPEGKDIGDSLEVFLYRDSKDRMIATTREPKLKMGEVALLDVSDAGKMGAFLDWGLEKDLLLPFKQQTAKVKVGDKPLVSLYIDKSDRLCATMNVYENLKKNSPYKKDDRVTGRVYQISEEFGAFVAVDHIYSGLIPRKDYFGDCRIGEDITVRVTAVKEDGKLDLSIREKAYMQIEADAARLLEIIDSFDGVLPFTDKANPEVIRRETNMSKNEFKRAVGNLLKNGKIEIKETAIRKK